MVRRRVKGRLEAALVNSNGSAVTRQEKERFGAVRGSTAPSIALNSARSCIRNGPGDGRCYGLAATVTPVSQANVALFPARAQGFLGRLNPLWAGLQGKLAEC